MCFCFYVYYVCVYVYMHIYTVQLSVMLYCGDVLTWNIICVCSVQFQAVFCFCSDETCTMIICCFIGCYILLLMCIVTFCCYVCCYMLL